MTDPDDKPLPGTGSDEPFLERWSRRKAQAREGIDDEAVQAGIAEPAAPAAQDEQPAAVIELPDLDSLGEDSDYSAFMAPGVDPSLRRKALRKLFSSPKFNVTDGMDDYCGDWRSYSKLGDIVTADMRYHIERAAKLAEKIEEVTGTGETPARPEAVAAAAAAPQASPAPEPPPGPAEDDPERDA